jgi:hypothetical protein
MTFFLLMHLRRIGRFVSEGSSGVGLRTVKVFAKNTTRRCGDFLQNLHDLDRSLIARKHLCPLKQNGRCDRIKHKDFVE